MIEDRGEYLTYVALESALEDQLFGHCNVDEVMQRIKVRGEKEKVKGCSAKPRPVRILKLRR